MPREVDEKKTRGALRKIARAKAKADAADEAARLTDWETEFVDSVETRLTTYGSAFNDPEKGSLSEPLSARQGAKLREIDKKARGKARKPMSRGQGFKPKPGSGFKQSSFKAKGQGPRVRDINDDIIGAVPDTPRKAVKPKRESPVPALKPVPLKAVETPAPKAGPEAKPARPVFRVVKGGKEE